MIQYLRKSAGARWFDYLLKETLKHVDPKEIKSVADIGCGVGNKTKFLAEYFPKAKVTGFDFSKEGIEAASKTHRRKNLSYSTADVTKLGSKSSFDLITAFDLLEHIEDWKKLTTDLIQKNNKYILVSSPVGRMRPYEVHIGHVRNFKKREIETFMEKHGYTTKKTFYAGFPFYSPILRNLTDKFYKNYAGLPEKQMTKKDEFLHSIWYVLFRYFSLKNRGDIFVGLFVNEKK